MKKFPLFGRQVNQNNKEVSFISYFPERRGEWALAARRAFLESTVALELVAYLIECPSL